MKSKIDKCMETDQCSCETGMSQKALDFEKIQIKENEVKNSKGLWLKKLGWKYRCDFVDGGWRWCKEIEGKMMMCDMSEAINIEYNYINQ